MVAVVFGKVEDAVPLTDSRYKVRVSLRSHPVPIQPNRSSVPPRQSRVILHFSSLPSKNLHYVVVWSILTAERRLFEVFMAYDALRLRNVIQLVGLLCTLFQSCLKCGHHLCSTPFVPRKYSMRPSSLWPHCKCTKPTPLWSPSRESTGLWTTWCASVVYPSCVTAAQSSHSTVMERERFGNECFLS